MLSPVIAAWSIEDSPSVTVPSSGITSPGRTIAVSPTRTSLTGTITSSSSRLIRAVCGATSRSDAIERCARPAAYTSRNSAMAKR